MIDTTKPLALLLTKDLISSIWLKKHLQKQFSILQETEAKEALEHLQFSPIELVILEDVFAKDSLFEFLSLLKEASLKSWLPILLITSHEEKAFQRKALFCGATDFLFVPLEEKELYRKIRGALRTKQLEAKISYLSKDLSSFSLDQEMERSFTYQLKQLFVSSHTKQPVSILLLQIDDFPSLEKNTSVEDRQRILLLITQVLSQSIENKDNLTPMEKGKFLLMLPHKSEESAKEFAKSLQKKIKTFPLSHSLSFSAVVSSLQKNSDLYMAQHIFRKVITAYHSLLQKGRKGSLINP